MNCLRSSKRAACRERLGGSCNIIKKARETQQKMRLRPHF
jgi:hypothetical protein